MVMPGGGATSGQARFGKTLLFHWRIRVIENAPDGRTINSNKWFLIGKLLDSHAMNSAGKMKKNKSLEAFCKFWSFGTTGQIWEESPMLLLA